MAIRRYRLPPQTDIDDVRKAWRSAFQTTVPRASAWTHRYYDTWDGRLYRAGYRLRLEASERRHRLILYRESDPWHHYISKVADGLRFAGDLPEGPMRDRLSKMTAPRALLPRMDLAFSETTFRYINEDEKTLVRVALRDEVHVVDPETGRSQNVAALVELRPVKGYVGAYENATRFLRDIPGTAEMSESLYRLGMEALDKSPAGESSKFDVPLSPDMSADEAVKRIGKHLLTTMQMNTPGMLSDLDSEFLHDYRIAVRRTRSMLAQLKRLFPVDFLEHIRAEFKWTGQATGPVRDMDVYLLRFDEYVSWLSDDIQPHLEPLQAFLIRRKERVHEGLVEVLEGRRYEWLIEEWTRYLDRPAGTPPTEAAALPVLQVASRRIWKAYRRVVREGEQILNHPDAPAERLHELRISCKKLRYLLEMFASLYPAGALGVIIKALKRLLRNLGDFQDFEVQQHKLREFARLMIADGGTPPETYLAMGHLEVHLAQLQQEARKDFGRQFQSFRKSKIEKRFKSLFHSA